MPLFQNEELFETIENQISDANEKMKDVLIREPLRKILQEDSAGAVMLLKEIRYLWMKRWIFWIMTK